MSRDFTLEKYSELLLALRENYRYPNPCSER